MTRWLGKMLCARNWHALEYMGGYVHDKTGLDEIRFRCTRPDCWMDHISYWSESPEVRWAREGRDGAPEWAMAVVQGRSRGSAVAVSPASVTAGGNC